MYMPREVNDWTCMYVNHKQPAAEAVYGILAIYVDEVSGHAFSRLNCENTAYHYIYDEQLRRTCEMWGKNYREAVTLQEFLDQVRP